ncbi:MAG: serine/threonine-protein kinase [Polyangiales bacterium]
MPDRPDPKPPLDAPASFSARAAAAAPVDRVLAGRFEVLRWLGEGGMGTVYLTRDRKVDRRVAVKVLLAGNAADALTRFKQEFRALADISHPNLIVLHELLCDQGTWLFSMDYVEGRDFLSHVSALENRDTPTLLEADAQRLRDARRGAPMPRCPVRDETMLRRVLAQLVDAVRSLHAAGKLHLDLKPSNVLVDAKDHVTVLDFGLARDLRQNSPLWTQRLLGTPAYMAPEHAESGRFEPASDWYGVGVMLYEALCGRLPFEGTVAQILLAKTTHDPDPPSRYARDVPHDLERLCMDLLARDPSKRPDGAAILERVGTVTPISQVQVSSTTSELFVGRTRALASLHQRDSHPAEARIVLLRGAAGVGKTTLARRYLDELAARPRTVVLRGACFEREAMPFKAFDGIVDALIAHLGKLSTLEAGAILPRHAHSLARLFPAFSSLAALPVPRRLDDDDPATGRARAFAAFAELFGRLSDQADVVLFIDDLHFGDRDSAQLVHALFASGEPVPLTLIGTYRPDDAEPSPLVEELREVAKITPKVTLEEAELGALDEAEARGLSEALLRAQGITDAQMVEHLARESHGIPLFIHELVRHASQKDAAPRRKVSLDEVLSERVAALPEAARKLLEALAVAGGPTPKRVAFRAALLRSGQDSALHTLRVAGLAKSRGGPQQDLIDAAHDRARTAARARLAPDAIARTHARLLAAFEAEPNPDDERLFVHSMGASNHGRALVYAERAATHAQEVLAFHRSVDLYRTALSLLDRERPDDDAHRGRLLAQLGNALAAGGYCLDAAQIFLDAMALGAPEDVPVFERKAADQLLRGGDLQAGSALLARVLERVGVSYPRTPRAALAALTFERARLFARGLSFEERAPESMSGVTHALLEGLKVALGVYWLVEPVRGALFATQYLRQALEVGHARHVRRGLEIEGAYVALTGGAKGETRAGELYASARALTQRVGSAGSRAGNLIAEAGFHAIYGRKQKSTECAAEALRAPTTQAASWERTYARFHLYQNTLYIGGRPGLASEIAEHVADAEQRRDRFSAATLLPMLALAHLMGDAPREADAALAHMRTLLSPDVFGFLDVQEMIYTGLTQQYRGDVAGALATYTARGERYQQSGMPRLSTWRVLHLWGTLLAHLGAVEVGLDAARNLAAAEDRIKQLEREKIAWPQPFVHAGRAALLGARGQPAARDDALQQAIGHARELGYKPFVLLFSLAAGRLKSGSPRDDLRRMEQELNALGIAEPSRWRRVWAPGLG